MLVAISTALYAVISPVRLGPFTGPISPTRIDYLDEGDRNWCIEFEEVVEAAACVGVEVNLGHMSGPETQFTAKLQPYFPTGPQVFVCDYAGHLQEMEVARLLECILTPQKLFVGKYCVDGNEAMEPSARVVVFYQPTEFWRFELRVEADLVLRFHPTVFSLHQTVFVHCVPVNDITINGIFMDDDTMYDSFVLFPRLPTEIRQLIWRMAFDEWKVSTCKEICFTRRPLDVDDQNRSIAQSCKEALSVRYSTCVRMSSGWINFNYHVFLVQGPVPERDFWQFFPFLYHLQHIVLSPRNFEALDESVCEISMFSSSLRHLVLVGPWFSPRQMYSVAFHTNFKLWTELRSSDVSIQSLLDIFNETDATDIYMAELGEILRLEPRHRLEFARRAHESLTTTLNVLGKFPDPKPRLHLRLEL
ncbi:hypothetical protein CDD80_7449 [Ophiocordyceps camponoti-rufipedis]|uniref:2EXR domain-containing protein n=1 Tax=Ophiocordyceps camponoti-rufipedis TaxID=2004952 RepID=A0A2C5ZF36_9HYPO|nr:hypothetical protein CDD80_7449 [Ophiocordyceps camponoti-rufipedis]